MECLRIICLKVLGINAWRFNTLYLQDLPKVILSSLLSFISAKELDRLDGFFLSKGIETESTWKNFKKIRWHTKLMEKETQSESAHSAYLNLHFRDLIEYVIYQAYYATDPSDCISTCLHQPIKEKNNISMSKLKENSYSELKFYAAKITSLGMNCIICNYLAKNEDLWPFFYKCLKQICIFKIQRYNPIVLRFIYNLNNFGCLTAIKYHNICIPMFLDHLIEICIHSKKSTLLFSQESKLSYMKIKSCNSSENDYIEENFPDTNQVNLLSNKKRIIDMNSDNSKLGSVKITSCNSSENDYMEDNFPDTNQFNLFSNKNRIIDMNEINSGEDIFPVSDRLINMNDDDNSEMCSINIKKCCSSENDCMIESFNDTNHVKFLSNKKRKLNMNNDDTSKLSSYKIKSCNSSEIDSVEDSFPDSDHVNLLSNEMTMNVTNTNVESFSLVNSCANSWYVLGLILQKWSSLKRLHIIDPAIKPTFCEFKGTILKSIASKIESEQLTHVTISGVCLGPDDSALFKSLWNCSRKMPLISLCVEDIYCSDQKDEFINSLCNSSEIMRVTKCLKIRNFISPNILSILSWAIRNDKSLCDLELHSNGQWKHSLFFAIQENKSLESLKVSGLNLMKPENKFMESIEVCSFIQTLTLTGCCLDFATIKSLKFAQVLVNHPLLTRFSLVDNQMGKSIFSLLHNIMLVIIEGQKYFYPLQHLDLSYSQINEDDLFTNGNLLKNLWSSRSGFFMTSLKVHGIYSGSNSTDSKHIFSSIISNVDFDYILFEQNLLKEYLAQM